MSIDPARSTEIVVMLDGMLHDGESITVCNNSEHIEILNESTDLRSEHPKLYGRLLSTSEQLSDAGTSTLPIIGIVCLAFCLAIQLDWFEAFDIDTEKIRSLWFYGGVLLGGFIVFGFFVTVLEGRVFRRHRQSLAKAAQDADYDRFGLLSEIEGDPSLTDVAAAIKKDDRFGSDRELF
jgi:hypothetical protein